MIKTPPTEEKLRTLCENGLWETAELLIKEHKLTQFIIKDGKLAEALVGTEKWLAQFITVDPETLALKDIARKLANCPDEILIHGATGTGKEIIARSMIGDRKGPFKSVNCGGLPENLVESELFGHKRGSFTGATVDKVGMFEAAANGVMFLDEVADLPLNIQGKLLRALQEKVVRPVGSNEEIKINCKFVAASKKSLKKMLEKDTFRDDLYARLSTFELDIKSIKERQCDIKPIIEAMGEPGKLFLAELAKMGRRIDELETRFNVRSLQQYVKRFAVLGKIEI